eukprot:g41917.t1
MAVGAGMGLFMHSMLPPGLPSDVMAVTFGAGNAVVVGVALSKIHTAYTQMVYCIRGPGAPMQTGAPLAPTLRLKFREKARHSVVRQANIGQSDWNGTPQ